MAADTMLYFTVRSKEPNALSLSQTLKETYYAHFQVHNFVVNSYWNRFTCTNAQKMHLFSHTVQCCSKLFWLLSL